MDQRDICGITDEEIELCKYMLTTVQESSCIQNIVPHPSGGWLAT